MNKTGFMIIAVIVFNWMFANAQKPVEIMQPVIPFSDSAASKLLNGGTAQIKGIVYYEGRTLIGIISEETVYAPLGTIVSLYPLTHINGLSNLEHLYVQNNFLLSSIDVSGLNKLEKIDAENNKIETVMLTKAPQLKYVNLKNNLLSETVEIRELANLEYFNAECCNLLYINFSSIVRLKEYYW